MADTSTLAATGPYPESEDEQFIELPSGKGFSFASAEELAHRYFGKVIVFAGTAKSGKTTLLSTLSLLFHRGPFAGHLFSGSETLVGFEERNFYLEVASGLHEPNMERTIVAEVLHLKVRRAELKTEASDLLLCDMSGEDFREAKDSMEVCKRMTILRRADTFVLLIDGKKLSDPTARQRSKNDPLTLLRNCLDGDMLRFETAVDILFTKWDHVQENPDRAEIESFADKITEDIHRQFSSRIKSLQITRIAAHPTEGNLPLGFGVEEPFRRWIYHRADKEPQQLNFPRGCTEFDNYYLRKLGNPGGG